MPNTLRLTCGLMLGGVLAAGIWLMGILGQLGQPHPANQWVLEAYAHKAEAAASLDAPKVIVAGGSSAMFGVDTSRLETELGRPTVNLAVNAGVGLPVILNRTLEVARRGDAILLVLEYPLFGYNGEINHVMNDFYLSHPDELMTAWDLVGDALSPPKGLMLIAKESVQMVMQTPVSRVMAGYRGLPDGFIVSGTYGAHRLDARGDQTGSGIAQRETWMQEQVRSPGPQRYGVDHSPDAAGWSLLVEFQTRLAARGACLVIMPPAFLFDTHYVTDPVERVFYTQLPDIAARRGLRYVGRPLDFMYAAGAMFDTDYHLVSEARDANTLRMLHALGQQASAPGQPLEKMISCPGSTI